VSEAVDLRATQTRELVLHLGKLVADFAAREDALTRDIHGRKFAAKRKLRAGIDSTDTWLANERAALEEHATAESARMSKLYDQRRTRIQRARTAGLRNLPRRAQEARGRWMGDLQLRRFRAERKLAAQLQDVAGEYNDFTTLLAGQRTLLEQLERRARRYLRGYRAFVRNLERKPATLSTDAEGAPAALADEMRIQLEKAEAQLRAFRAMVLPRAFSDVPAMALLAPILILGVVVAIIGGATLNAWLIGGATAAALIIVVLICHRIGRKQGASAAGEITALLAQARIVHDRAFVAAEQRRDRDRQRFNSEYETTCASIDAQWDKSDDVETEFHKAARAKIESQEPRIAARIEAAAKPRLERIAAERDDKLAEFTQRAETRKQQLQETHDAEMAALNAEEASRWSALEQEWNAAIRPLFETIRRMQLALGHRAVGVRGADAWSPPTEFPLATKFGELRLDLRRPPAAPAIARLHFPGPPEVTVPLALSFPQQGSLLFETNESAESTLVNTLNTIIVRLLADTPPGKVSFTIIDPVGLGQNFAGLMHLGDYEESLINRRIWTQRDQIEERLGELSEHIEKVIQMYLRNEYATITEYNAQAGSVAEKYHFLVIADFPANFSELAARRLQSIAVSGPRCGVYTLIHWDQRLPLPEGISPEELRKASVCLRRQQNGFFIDKALLDAGVEVALDPAIDPDRAVELIHQIGRSSIDSNRVEVPFAQIAPKAGEMWTLDTTNELRVAIGRTGATKLQYLAIGKGTRQHALFAGKTGSGKSTLFHVIITNLALSCSPEQVEFYLVDFKKGVEFKCYATKHLPHARVVAIESDREFALSVLQRVDEELKRRGDMFRKLGVQDIAGYKRAGGTESIPRALLIIDEFQEFFVEDDAIAQTASLLFDRIVRQGRAFGIHVLLGSQTLGGAYTLARATLGQMVIRVALQCNEADAYLIMDDNNSAARLLSRPGEGIYNDAAGAIEGNSPFQVVWLSDEERNRWLDSVRTLADARHDRHARPIVFEGNAPADARENMLLQKVFETVPTAPPVSPRIWLGAPNAIKGPTEIAFHRQSGNNVIIVGQRDEAALTLLGLGALALAAQHPPGSARFLFLHSTNPGTPDATFIERILAAIPHEVVETRGHDLVEVVHSLSEELKARNAENRPEAPSIYFFIHGLQRFKKLRQEDDFDVIGGDTVKSGAEFNVLICDGASHGIHVITSTDTFNNVNRFISRKALSEFEVRVVFQMSANDSASLIDSPKASSLGLHRALLYNEHEGSLETFRPYAMPDSEWLAGLATQLRSRSAAEVGAKDAGAGAA
jgi:DNA segregation ATPase FtsK/SpoIIIE-like protein